MGDTWSFTRVGTWSVGGGGGVSRVPHLILPAGRGDHWALRPCWGYWRPQLYIGKVREEREAGHEWVSGDQEWGLTLLPPHRSPAGSKQAH